ncbi:MAG TPA: hypothetical protein VFV99_10860 [Kofleriaceae bacterium]|nr:hypothetical protein [Kofleriaceae bacterium]
MAFRCALLVLLLDACGRFGFSGQSHEDATPGGGDDASSDSAVIDGALTDSVTDTMLVDAPPCTGTTHTITDNFDDNSRNTALWGNAYADSVTSYAETGGHVVITLGVNIANNWAGYMTTSGYSIAGDRVFVEVPQVSNPTTNTILLLWTSLAKTDGPSIEWEANKLFFRMRINDQIFDRANVTYSATTHRWWQIRERAGTMYWETSPDGVSWTVQHMEATPASTTAYITFAAGTNSANATPGTAIFDNFNGGGAPPSCP